MSERWTEDKIRQELDKLTAPPPPEPVPPPAAFKLERDIMRISSSPLTCGDVLRNVVNVTGVSVIDIKSERRSHHIVRARHIYFYACHKATTKSYPLIAKLVNRDHSTAMHGIQAVEGNRKRYEPHLTIVLDLLEVDAKEAA